MNRKRLVLGLFGLLTLGIAAAVWRFHQRPALPDAQAVEIDIDDDYPESEVER